MTSRPSFIASSELYLPSSDNRESYDLHLMLSTDHVCRKAHAFANNNTNAYHLAILLVAGETEKAPARPCPRSGNCLA